MERPEPDMLSITRYARGAHKPTPDQPVDPMPGTIEESEALAAIDQARYAEMYPQSRRKQRARLRRHWSDREHALGN